MWQPRSTSERLDDIERWFRKTFGSSDGEAEHHIIRYLQHMEKRIMASIDDLKAAVARETEVENSVVTLLDGISQQLKDLKTSQGDKIDPAALDAIIADLDANTAKLGAAVTANTPVSGG